MATEWGTRVEPSGEILPAPSSQDAHRMLVQALCAEDVTAAELVGREDGGEWSMRARYMPGDFDSEGNFIHRGF